MKKSINFLIAAIVPTLAGLIYMIFEDNLLQVLASLPQNTNQRIIVRTALLSVILLILGLSYFILEFRSKYISAKKNAEELKPANDKSTNPSLSTLRSKTKDIPFEDLIWIATKFSDGAITVKDVPRCKDHDYLLTYDGHTYHCPETIKGNCNMKLSRDDLSRLKRIATSYIDKQFRDEPPPPPPSPRPKSNWVMGWRR